LAEGTCSKCLGLVDLASDEDAQQAVDAALRAAPAEPVGGASPSPVRSGLSHLLHTAALWWVISALLLIGSASYAVFDPRVASLRDENLDLLRKREKNDLEVAALKRSVDELAKKLEEAKHAVKPPSPAEAFKFSFEECLNSIAFEIDNKRPDRPEVKLFLSPEIRLPYFTSLDVHWDAENRPADWEALYRWRGRPISMIATHGYQRNPEDAPRKVVVKLVFLTGSDAQKSLKAPESVEKRFEFLFTSQGLFAAPEPSSSSVTVKILEPIGKIRETFRLSLFLQAPKELARQESMVFVLLKPENGSKMWSESYYVLQPRMRVADLAKLPQGQSIDAEVSLRQLLGSPTPADEFPTKYKVLVVQMPFRLQSWKLPAEMLNPNSPAFKTLIVQEHNFELPAAEVPQIVFISQR
jgi:hypothetical protein